MRKDIGAGPELQNHLSYRIIGWPGGSSGPTKMKNPTLCRRRKGWATRPEGRRYKCNAHGKAASSFGCGPHRNRNPRGGPPFDGARHGGQAQGKPHSEKGKADSLPVAG